MPATTIGEYIAAQPPKVRAILRKIRATVRTAAPDAEETISYRMPTFKQRGVLIHFAAFKEHVGIYPPVRGDAKLLKALAPYSGEKGNLRFSLEEPMRHDLITRIVKTRLAQNLAKVKVVVVLIGASALGGQALTAQSPEAISFTAKRCDPAKVPIGVLPSGAGTITFQVGKDGKADTASVGVLSVDGLSVAGFRSVAVRRLVGCRFQGDGRMSGDKATVVGTIAFDSSRVAIGAAHESAATVAALPLEPFAMAPDSFPLALADMRNEERPRRLQCKAAMSTSTTTRVSGTTVTRVPAGSSPAQVQAAVADAARSQVDAGAGDWNRENAGTLLAELLINRDGRPAGRMRVVELSNPTAGTSLAAMLASCDFVPGRYRGVIVPMLVQSRMTVGEMVVR